MGVSRQTSGTLHDARVDSQPLYDWQRAARTVRGRMEEEEKEKEKEKHATLSRSCSGGD